MFGRDQIPVLEDKIRTLVKKSEKIKASMRGLIQHGQEHQSKIPNFFSSRLLENQTAAAKLLSAESVHRFLAWNSPDWQNWSLPAFGDMSNLQEDPNLVPNTLRIGEFVESRSNTDFKLPAMIPFIGGERTIIIQTDDATATKGLELLQSLLIRAALSLPHQTLFTLLDPGGLGRSFPMRGLLPEGMDQKNTQDARRDLDVVNDRITRLNTSFLGHKAFHEVDMNVRVNEKYNLIFAADFPNKYDHRAIEALIVAAQNGPRAGTYVFIHHNTKHKMPMDIDISAFENAEIIDLANAKYQLNGMNLSYDTVPAPPQQQTIFKKLADVKPPESKIEFGSGVEIPENTWWQNSAANLISTPIGAVGASGRLDLWLGQKNEDAVVHGVVAGATGMGKSNLYHVFIMGLAMRYSPEELRFVLIDGKDGVEFETYSKHKLPHVDIISLNSSPQLSRNILKELNQEQERRNALFKTLGVASLREYRERGQPNGKLPRILLLVDEYQQLFEGDDKLGEASIALESLAKQGRSAGIHMMLGSQSFSVGNAMRNRNEIFNNILLRMAMKMPSDQIQSLSEFQREGKSLIETCDSAGKIVVNNGGGRDGTNQLGKVALLDGAVRNAFITKLAQKANAELSPEDNPITIVFDGKAQPNFSENAQVEYLLQQKSWLSADDMQETARRSTHAKGFGKPDWNSSEIPFIAWAGKDFSVRGQAAIVFRRGISENALVIGANNMPRYGILGALIASLTLNKSPKDIQFVILDRSISGTQWNAGLTQVAQAVLKPSGYTHAVYTESRDVEKMLDSVIQVMDSRRDMNERDLMYEPEIFCIMTELDRVPELVKAGGSYMMSETPLGDKLNQILQKGPMLGIHTIASFGNVRPMTQVIDERHTLPNFRHRIALQMGEDESLSLVRSRRATLLQEEGPEPIIALYHDVNADENIRFKPYSLSSQNYAAKMEELGQRLAGWSKPS